MGKAKKDSALYQRYLETYIAVATEDGFLCPTDPAEAAAAALAVCHIKGSERPFDRIEVEEAVAEMLKGDGDA